MGHPARLIAALSALAADAAARPLPSVNLTEAAVRGDLDAVRAFLDGGAAIEQRTIGFASPLAAAASRGHLEVVELLVARGASLDPEGSAFPLLAFPIANRKLDVVERLLKAGAPVAKYRSHFRLAAKEGQWDMVDAMLASGADPGWLSDAERTQLDSFVARERPRSPEYRARLREEQARKLDQARVRSAARPLGEAERAGHEAAAIAEIERDPSLARAATTNGTPLLALAVSSGARELVRKLLAAGADPNAAAAGETPLARAAGRSDVVLLTALLDAGADPDLAASGSPHPVVAASLAGSVACLDLLLARGARPRARDLEPAIERAGGPDAKRIVARLEALQTPAAQRKRAQLAASPAPVPAPDPAGAAAAAEEVKDMGNDIAGQVFAATGSFENLTQTGIQMSVEIRGGFYASSVTKKTTVLIAGAKAGAKLEKAKAQGVRILTEAQFHALLEQVPITEEMRRRYLG
ncbi:MAG: ankyrin repeat domain-containing protein [Vicinamibacteria bacterium]|nr:ankyrin repeat domain-containing protein [Vicinamibacteria bacterium]